MNRKLNKLEEWILAYILGYIEDNGYSPTRNEITEAWNSRHAEKMSRDAIDYRVRVLQRAGRIRYKKSRGWRNLEVI